MLRIRRGLYTNVAALGGVSFDADAQALFDAMTVQPSTERKAAYDDYIVGLKADGIWTKLDVLYILAAHDGQAARLNLKAPGTFTAALSATPPTFETDRGYTGNGTSSRLQTGFTPSTNGVNFVQDNASMWFWSRTDLASNTYPSGSVAGTSDALLNPRQAADNRAAGTINSNTQAATAIGSVTSSSGMFGITRAAAAAFKVWRNGVQAGANVANASTAVANAEQWICAANATLFDTRQIAMAAWGASLAGLESAFYSRTLSLLQEAGAEP